MELHGRSTATEGAHPDPDTGLEESMWRLGLGGGGGDSPYPERPGEPDCAYYMRTGSCGYGERCRYNHPRDRGARSGAGRTAAGEYPERVGQPVCEYYMRTGTCKFGSTCKYHHPRQGGGSVRPVLLNYSGYPLRPGEKECSYYMKTGQCKFGSTCKFHHPQPGGASVPSPAPTFYPTVQPPTVPSPHPYPPLASWQVGRPSVLPGSYMPGSYGPMLLSPGVVPVQGWGPYPAPVSPVVSPGGQQTVQAGHLYGLSSQVTASVPSYQGPYTPVSSSAGPSSGSQREHTFPERPGQPECQFYMRTGDCKFGSTCRYHHPRDWSMPKTNCALSPLGLPLRPGAQPCAYYAQHGVCKFGPTCKFDHPMGTLSYSPSASSLSDMPVAPYPIGFSVATLAPSSSSSDLRPEFISSKESFPTRMPSSENISSGSVGSIFSRGSFLPHSLIQPQASTSSSSSSIGHGGEISSSS
ncbi:zinc finger CCCH domain-containing protein 32 isoform X1 [Elaeis guineensis]|uniref:Zinc finger CCCH domain-containing protein 6 n=1 Tax=Elaeis guineensis var. tenera TaxID=51953 RepID=A0A6I9RDW3_ELAGV|nr:zinc finger CCCH domain-containing protein 6 [Elaeis guineensis]